MENFLTLDSWLDASNIHVSSENGVVMLVGIVDTWYLKRRTEDLALQAMGVHDVNNNLTIQIKNVDQK